MRATTGVYSAALIGTILQLMSPPPANALDNPTRQVLIDTVILEVGFGVSRASGDLGIDFQNVFYNDERMSFSRTRGFLALGASAQGPRIGNANLVFGLQSQIFFDSEVFNAYFEFPQRPNDQVRMIGRNSFNVLPFAGIEIPLNDSDAASRFNTRVRLIAGPSISDQRLIVDLIANGNVFEQSHNNLVVSPTVALELMATRVVLPEGQTILLGGPVEIGLKGSVQGRFMNAVPSVGEIPLLGALFTQDRKAEVSAQLQIFVTPHIVRSE